MKNLFVGCLGLIIGLILGAVLVIILFSTSKPNTPTPPVPSTRADVSVIVSASFAATQIQQTLRSSGIAKNGVITFAAPNLIRVAATVDANALGVPLSFNAIAGMRITVQKGRVILTTDSVDANGFAVPSSIINSTVEPVRLQAEEEINRVAQSTLRGTTLHLSNIRVTADDVTVDLIQ